MATMQDEMTAIADKVRGVAAENRADQESVAAILGISRQAVNQRFNGRVAFTGVELYRLSVAFRVPVSRFFPDRLPKATLSPDTAPPAVDATVPPRSVVSGEGVSLSAQVA